MYMPTKELVTECIKERSKERIADIWNELYWCRVDSVLMLFFIELYELSVIMYTPVEQKANLRYMANVYSLSAVLNLCTLRNTLVHNIYNTTGVRSTVYVYLTKITQPVFIDICNTCGLPGSVVWDTLLDICDKDDTTTRNYTTPTLLRLKAMQELIGE